MNANHNRHLRLRIVKGKKLTKSSKNHGIGIVKGKPRKL